MPALHAKTPQLVVANARHSPRYDCALRLDLGRFDTPFGHGRKLSASESVLFYGAVAVQMRQVSLPPNTLPETRRQHDVARACAALTEAEFDAACAEGAAMDRPSLLCLAQALLQEVPIDPLADD